jgi:hypothetical protein
MGHVQRYRRKRAFSTLALTRDPNILVSIWLETISQQAQWGSKLTKPLLLNASINLFISSVWISNIAVSAPLAFIGASATIAGADRFSVT